MKKSLSLVAAFLCSAVMAHSQVLLDVNFRSDTPGQVPASATSIINASNGRIHVVDAASTPADPFGGAGNRSLMIEKVETGAVPTVRWDFSQVSDGTVSASIYAPLNSDGFGSSGALYLYNNDTLAIGILWATNGKLSVMTRSSTTNSNEVIAMVSPLLIDEAADLQITFSEGRFSLSINGQMQESATGQTQFLLRGNQDTINNIRFAQSSTTTVNSRFFLNSFEVKAIPEPASAALLGVVGIGGLLSLKIFRFRASETK